MGVVAEVLDDTPGAEDGASLRKDIPPNAKDGKCLLGLLVSPPGPPRHFSAVKNVSGRAYVMDSLDMEGSFREVSRSRATKYANAGRKRRLAAWRAN